MKLTVAIVLLIAAAHAAEVKQSPKARQKTSDGKTDKRELVEGNAAVEKRAPVLATAIPSVTPGIEYADSKESQPEKSPSQQAYASPAPQISKISDLLTAQTPFQAAIASHLLSPVSVYQPRLAAPTTYEVSSPIASQLAYSEHKISYQPPQNALQYQPVQYNQKLQAPKQANFARPINFQQPYQHQIFVQPQPVVYSQQSQLLPIPQPVQYQQIPFQVERPVQFTPHNIFPQHFVHQPAYSQEQQPLVQVAPSVQPGITYAREESNEERSQEQASQSQVKTAEQPEESTKAAENPTPAPEKNYNTQSQGAVSYASFSQSQPAQSFAPSSHLVYQPQQTHQDQPQQFQAQPQRYQAQPQQYQAQPQHYQAQPQQYQVQPQQYQVQPQQYQVQPQQYQTQPQQFQAQPQQAHLQQYQPQPQQYQVQPVFHSQPQLQQSPQYEIQIQYQAPQDSSSKLSHDIATASSKTLPVNPQRPIAYFRPGPVLPQIQPNYHQPQSYPVARQVLLQNPGQASSHPLPAPPSFPPVQYFGKFAQSIFGGQH